MKLRVRILLLLFAVLALAAAATTTLIGTLVTINNTTVNSTSVALDKDVAVVNAHTLVIQNNGLTATGAMTVLGQVSLDNSNWVTVATWTPSVTNAGSYFWATPATNLTIYGRVQVTTTNSVQAGVVLLQ